MTVSFKKVWGRFRPRGGAILKGCIPQVCHDLDAGEPGKGVGVGNGINKNFFGFNVDNNRIKVVNFLDKHCRFHVIPLLLILLWFHLADREPTFPQLFYQVVIFDVHSRSSL
jgi:hypothetical protein